jgi:hypothetical protein
LSGRLADRLGPEDHAYAAGHDDHHRDDRADVHGYHADDDHEHQHDQHHEHDALGARRAYSENWGAFGCA